MGRWVLHVDLDQFIAAVEMLRRPELRELPVIVGGTGDPTKRGVVSTASYEARRYGVGSGMPLRTAARRCPEAVFLPVDAPAYEAASEQVMSALRELPAVVEVAGWDEAFLAADTDDPEALARQARRRIADRTRLSAAVGIGENKLQAKTATTFAKPGGVYRLTTATWMDVMGERSTEALWGIGAKTARRLAALGIGTVAELASVDDGTVAPLGPRVGPWLRDLARGVDGSPVSAEPHVPRSRSRETTFQTDLADWTVVQAEVDRLARRVAADVATDGRLVARVAVKVRYAPFLTHTRSVALHAPGVDPDVVAEAAARALGLFADDRRVRLIGVRAEFVR